MIEGSSLDAVDDVSGLSKITCCVERRIRERFVILIETRFEDSDDGEAFQPRSRTQGSRWAAEGRDQKQAIADTQSHRNREMSSDDDSGRLRLLVDGGEPFGQIWILLASERLEVFFEVSHAPDRLGVDPA